MVCSKFTPNLLRRYGFECNVLCQENPGHSAPPDYEKYLKTVIGVNLKCFNGMPEVHLFKFGCLRLRGIRVIPA